MTLEEEFYKIITPEGRQNYIIEGNAKMFLLLCKAVDKLVAAQHGVQADATNPLEIKLRGEVESFFNSPRR